MDIHRFEQVWIAVAMLFIVGLIATVTYGAVVGGVELVGDTAPAIQEPTDPAASPQFEDPGVYCNEDLTECDVYVVARQFLFRPGTTAPLEVPAGSSVTFHLTSRDVIHGFELVGTNVNVMAVPGQVAEFDVRFDEPREYGIVCNEYCGAGHHEMEGQLRVVPPSEYDETEA